MKIAFLSTIAGFPWGGADFLWTRAAEAAVARGDRLLLALSAETARHERVAALVRQGAALSVQSPPPPLPTLAGRMLNRLWRPPFTSDGVVKALAAFQPDLVIVSCGATYDLAYFPEWTHWLASTRTPFRIIANWQQEQPSLPADETNEILAVFSAVDLLAFVSTRNLEATRRHLGLALPHARVLHNPLRWQPADASPWPENDVARLATVSRLDEGKGIHSLLEALASLPASEPEWRLAVHGHGPQEPVLRGLVARLGLAPRIDFRGHVPALRDIWADQQLLCSPALEDGVPMTIPEALLCGRPVLATCVGGATDWIEDGQTGFLCPRGGVTELASTLQRALAARAQWPQMGRAAAESARQFYRPEDFQQLLAALA